MQVLKKMHESIENTAVALGLFDGVHIAHQQVLNTVVAFKHSENLIPTVMTFSLDFSYLPNNKKNMKLIFPDKIKFEIFERQGIERVYSPKFNEFSDMPANIFFQEFLVNRLHAKVIVCGYDYTFGKDAAGSTDDLSELCLKAGIELIIINPYKKNGKLVCSSKIREYLLDGDMEKTFDFLGGSYFIKGEVIKGLQNGHKLGFPTINQAFSKNQIIPKFGVYKTITYIDDDIYSSVTNVGIHPSIDNLNIPLAETHILGCDQDLYGKIVTVTFVKFIRAEQVFISREQLIDAIKDDIKIVQSGQ